MKIKEFISQNRRDFWATWECEHCGEVTDKKSGYDDSNFYENVIPDMVCTHCNKNSSGYLGS